MGGSRAECFVWHDLGLTTLYHLFVVVVGRAVFDIYHSSVVVRVEIGLLSDNPLRCTVQFTVDKSSHLHFRLK